LYLPYKLLFKIYIYIFLGKYNWKDGFISGAVYYYDEELIKLLTEVYGLASYTNPLHSDIFPGICKMEAEIVRLVVNLFNGNSNACGTVCILYTNNILSLSCRYTMLLPCFNFR